MKPTPTPEMIDVDALSNEIRRVDGNHTLGAGALAEALMPFLSAALSVQPAAAVVGEPEGWKLVPIEPTPEMIYAGILARMNIAGGYDGPSSWEAMLAAAPSAPDGWQPIETAPSKGRFLVMAAGSIERLDSVDPAYVHTIEANDGPVTCEAFESGKGFVDEFGEQYGLDGRVSDAEDLTVADDVLRLTHWRPLPAPPALGGKP